MLHEIPVGMGNCLCKDCSGELDPYNVQQNVESDMTELPNPALDTITTNDDVRTNSKAYIKHIERLILETLEVIGSLVDK